MIDCQISYHVASTSNSICRHWLSIGIFPRLFQPSGPNKLPAQQKLDMPVQAAELIIGPTLKFLKQLGIDPYQE